MNLFSSASKEEVVQRRKDRQNHCNHKWGQIERITASLLKCGGKDYLNFITKHSISGIQTCTECQYKRAVTTQEIIDWLEWETLRNTEWLKTLPIEVANCWIEDCRPHELGPFTQIEFEDFKNDPIVPTWFNLTVSSGQEWIWKKYELFDKLREWRNFRNMKYDQKQGE